MEVFEAPNNNNVIVYEELSAEAQEELLSSMTAKELMNLAVGE